MSMIEINGRRFRLKSIVHESSWQNDDYFGPVSLPDGNDITFETSLAGVKYVESAFKSERPVRFKVRLPRICCFNFRARIVGYELSPNRITAKIIGAVRSKAERRRLSR